VSDLLNEPGPSSTAEAKHSGKVASVIVQTADGRTFDLGAPTSRLFPLRRRLYLHKRRHELKEASHG
jgi:hypothetical protein